MKGKQSGGLSKLSRGKYLRYYLVGFADAEACFNVSVKKQKTARFGWVLDPLFQVTQRKENREVLEAFRKVMTCGRIIEKPGQKDVCLFLVDNRRQLAEKVIPFFEKYKLVTKKEDFEKFRDIVRALEKKEHQDAGKLRSLVKKAFLMNQKGKQRRYKLEDVLSEIN